jgi:hypothetical protein
MTTVSCDECGRPMITAQRSHAGRRYCATCYARCFKRRACAGCGMFSRLLRGDQAARCDPCVNDRPCARCGKTDYDIGRITPYGPVCGPCRPHFCGELTCPACGKAARRLSRVTRLGIETPVCQRCARADFATCSSCRRYRRLDSDRDGSKRCTKCRTQDATPCAVCNAPKPAGRGSLCEPCDWTRTLAKRERMNMTALSSPEIAQGYAAFVQWLSTRVGPKSAALKVNRHFEFFLLLDQRWGRMPLASELLQSFGAEGLRRFRLSMQWLAQACGVRIDAKAKREDSERRRIDAVLASVPADSMASTVLEAYGAALAKKQQAGAMTLSSIRLALQPAAALLIRDDRLGRRLPVQTSLDRYLAATPGQRAAIAGFVSFVARAFDHRLVIRVDRQQSARLRQKRLELEIARLLRSRLDGRAQCDEWIRVALQYFHKLPAKEVRDITLQDAIDDQGGWTIKRNGAEYWVPKSGKELGA